jgi:hypothetical protein
MNFKTLTCGLTLLAASALAGCGGSEPTVVEPETYELSEQEQANRERAQKALAEQRQQ